jgi:hypothetical protein
MATTLARRRATAAGASAGSGVLRGTWLFDFDAGIETANQQAADVWWEQMTATTRQMVPLNGAALCGMGIVPFDPLSLADLQRLPYARTPIPANVSGTNLLPDGSVFAVRTRTGNFVKVQVLHYDYNLQIRWQTCTKPINVLDVKVTLGSTPAWLVTRYVVECTYNTPTGIRICGTGTFGPEGGIVQGQVSDEGGAFPPSILVTVSLDFQPETGLTAITKKFTPPVTNTGVNFIFEPFQVLQKTDVLLDLQPAPKPTDYLLLRWRHDVRGQVVASGQKYLPGDELRQQLVTQYEIVFVPDPIAAEHFNIQIEGRFQGTVLPLFTQQYDLADKAVLIRAQRSTSPPGYTLVSV